MVSLFVDNPHAVQMLSMLGIGAILVIAGCLLSDSMAELLGRFSRLGWMCRIGVLVVVAQLTMFGGAKHGGTNDVTNVDGTNEVEIVSGGGQSNLISGDFGLEEGRTLHCPSPPLLSTSSMPLADIACGYRLESVATNDDISYTMPSEGTVRGTWHLTGAYEDVQKVSLDGFAFPLGSDLCTSLWAHTWGKVRSSLSGTGVSPVQGWSAQNGQDATTVATSLREATFGRWISSTCEIAAVGVPMSAIPEVSRFWTAATSNDTYLMTWENFALGRIPVCTNISSLIPHPSSLVSAQLELSRNGDFITRSNNVESVYRRVIEPNPDPLHPYGPVQDLSVINETNAYCWVDIVVDADAWVCFEGDGPSNLADPSFAAKAGETNHVVILIGKTYTINCDIPFEVVGTSDCRIDVYRHSRKMATVVWPVDIYMDYGYSALMAPLRSPPQNLLAAPLLGLPSGGPWLRVDPDWLNGAVSMPENVCCGVSGTGGDFEFACANGDCGCGGCTVSGSYTYEGYTITFGGWECGCVPHGHDDNYDLSEWGFSAPEVVFKDGALRELSVWFDPGVDDDNSGQLVLTQTKGQDKIRIWEDERKTMTASRFSWPVANGVSCTYYIEGVESSDSVGDIGFKLEWVKEDGPEPDNDEMTCAEVVELRVGGNKCGSSPNPPPFTGQEPHDFNVTHSPNPDQHAVVFFKDVVNDADFTVNPFDVYIDLQLKPTDAPVGWANWFALRPTPSSGSLSSVSPVRGRLSNPTVGGVYHIGASFYGSPTNECNIVLPLAGAEMSGVLLGDIAKANGFVNRSKANWPRRWYSRAMFAAKWFSFDKYGFYRGRPDNANKPTVWCYNQIRDNDGKGAVGTLFGVPIHIEKQSNLLAAYVCERLKVPLEEQGIAQVIGTDNDPSADLSWTIGTRLAQTGAFNREVGYLATNAYQWASEKCRKLWPNRNAADNHRDGFGHGDFNVEFSSPGFIYCEQ